MKKVMKEIMSDDELVWQQMMEVLVVGALRGMVEAHQRFGAQLGGRLPPITEVDVNDAALILTGTIVEASPACDDERNFGKAANTVRRAVLEHMRSCRDQRDSAGRSIFEEMLQQAGITMANAH